MERDGGGRIGGARSPRGGGGRDGAGWRRAEQPGGVGGAVADQHPPAAGVGDAEEQLNGSYWSTTGCWAARRATGAGRRVAVAGDAGAAQDPVGDGRRLPRKLAEMGCKRSAKKYREKFENINKYYKRTKHSRSRRGDGKTYRFFTELARPCTAPPPLRAPPPPVSLALALVAVAPLATPAGLSALRVHTRRRLSCSRLRCQGASPLRHLSWMRRRILTMDDVSFSSGPDTEETTEKGRKRKRRRRQKGDGDVRAADAAGDEAAGGDVARWSEPLPPCSIPPVS